MLPSIPVAEFVQSKPGSRARNAINKAIDLAPTAKIELVGEIRGERWYRVRGKGRDRHCVIRWYSQLSREEAASCDCEAFRIPQVPIHCWHVAAVLIKEAQEDDGQPTQRKENPVAAEDRIAAAG